MIQSTLVLMFKRPSIGNGKQRLAASIGPHAALQVAEALLACTLEDVLAWPFNIVIAPAQPQDREWAKLYFRQKNKTSHKAQFKVIPQTHGNLGERLNVLDQSLRADGLNRLIYIGSDSPQLTLDDLIQTDQALNSADMVFKPTIDGGVSIMASNRAWPELTHLPWSTSRLGDELYSLCHQNEHSITKMSLGFDVDELADLFYLEKELANDRRPSRRALCQLALYITQQKTSKQKMMLQSERPYA